MPCRTLGTYGACTRRSRSLWAMDRKGSLNTHDISYTNTYVWLLLFIYMFNMIGGLILVMSRSQAVVLRRWIFLGV
ncbi:hypothetical protein Hanom_Chr00s147292g01820711 [Helianthus anomalus]